VDDFCKVFIPTWEKTQLDEGCKKRHRTRSLTSSEIITLIMFYSSGCGQIPSFRITHGNIDDREPVPSLLKHFIGKVFGDRGYISKKRAEFLL
jgi:hypothetical protein